MAEVPRGTHPSPFAGGEISPTADLSAVPTGPVWENDHRWTLQRGLAQALDPYMWMEDWTPYGAGKDLAAGVMEHDPFRTAAGVLGLLPMPGGKGAPSAKFEAPFVSTGDAPLVDYGLQHGGPTGNPLGLDPLPYYKGARGRNERTQRITKDRKVKKELDRSIQRGLDDPETRDAALNFYNNEPLRAAWHEHYEGPNPDQAFLDYMKAVAGQSAQMPVAPNAAAATQIYRATQRGEPIPNHDKKNPSNVPLMPENLLTPGAQTRGEVTRKLFGEHEEAFDPFGSPKVYNFMNNLSGVDDRVTVDSHASRLVARATKDPDWLAGSVRYDTGEVNDKGKPIYDSFKPRAMFDAGGVSMKELMDKPTYWMSRPSRGEYGSIAELYHRGAKRNDLTPAQAQAAAWFGGNTGVKSAPETFPHAFERRLRENAEARGIPPEQLLRDIINGRDAMLGLTGMGVGLTAPLMMDAPSEEEPTDG